MFISSNDPHLNNCCCTPEIRTAGDATEVRRCKSQMMAAGCWIVNGEKESALPWLVPSCPTVVAITRLEETGEQLMLREGWSAQQWGRQQSSGPPQCSAPTTAVTAFQNTAEHSPTTQHKSTVRCSPVTWHRISTENSSAAHGIRSLLSQKELGLLFHYHFIFKPLLICSLTHTILPYLNWAKEDGFGVTVR